MARESMSDKELDVTLAKLIISFYIPSSGISDQDIFVYELNEFMKLMT